jgi:FMN phosphatase YigB (HAD superfamily)
MKIFIDFDDVLFNTRDFIADIKVVFRRSGISEDVFYKTYKNRAVSLNKDGENAETYDPCFHFKKIKEETKINTDQLKNDFMALKKDTSKYIFPDVCHFLSKVQKKDIFILSFGTNKFQKEKIKNSGIGKRFNKIIVTERINKGEAIGKIIGKSKEKFYFIDDRVKFLEEVKKKYPFAITVLIRRKEGRYKDKKNKCCDFLFDNLKQTLEIIKYA